MWTDAALENWRLRQRVELSRPWPSTVVLGPPASPGPYERVQSGNGVVRLKLKPAKVDLAPLFDDGVDDLWRD